MRRCTFTAVLVNCVLATFAAAQTGAYDASVRQPAEVRGGRSGIFAVTARLPAGFRIRVLREEAGWLAIAPPDGSSSWIMERVLDQPPSVGQRKICVVLADDVPVLLGSSDQPLPLTNQVTTLKRGTQVVVLGEKATSDALGDRTTWWRIQPHATEVRWVNKDVLSQPAYAPVPTYNSASTVQPNTQPMPELWTRAEQAERAGRNDLAATYYRQFANEQARPGGDNNRANQASARADYLMRRPPTTTTARTSASPAISSPTAGRWDANQMMTSGPGNLRRAAFQIDGVRAFALEDDRGYPRMYVVPQPGLNLEPFVNRRVELFGPMVNRQELILNGYLSVKTLHVLR